MPGETLLARRLDQPLFDPATATPGCAILCLMALHARAQALDEGDSLLADLAKMVPDVGAWLDTPNYSLGGQRPRALLRTEDGRWLIQNLVEAVKHGMMT